MIFPSWIVSHPFQNYTIPGSPRIKNMHSLPAPIQKYEQAKILSERCFIKVCHGKAVTLELPKKAFSLLPPFWHSFQTGPDPACPEPHLPLWPGVQQCTDTPKGEEDRRLHIPDFALPSPAGVLAAAPRHHQRRQNTGPYPGKRLLFSEIVSISCPGSYK